MEREATTSRGLYGEGERGGGGGGKFRKPAARKLSKTPYDRPPAQTQTQQRIDGGGGGWLSKLVNPATRLISNGATRILPSFFSKALFGSDSDPSDTKQDDSDENPEDQSNIQIAVEGGQGPTETDRSVSGSDIDERVGEQLGNAFVSSSFSEIEQMMKEKTFSRDDLNRLTELLRSRVADQSDVDEGLSENLNITSRSEANRGPLVRENTPPVEENRERNLDRVNGALSTPLPQLRLQDQVGASPIDIAKAYMGGRTAEIGLNSPIQEDERTPLPTGGFLLKPSTTSPTPKSSICWPGAVVQDQRAYQTPLTERRRIGLHNLPRTPYSRPVHSRSISQLQDGRDRSINISSNQLKPSYTPNFGYSQVTRTKSPNVGFGSAGPIRRTRQMTPFRGSVSPHLSKFNRVENSDAAKGFFQNKHDLESGPSTSSNVDFQTLTSKPPSSSSGVSTVHPQSSEVARKILEHLDRTTTTPQKKSDELKMVTSWRKSSFPESTTGTPNVQFKEAQHRSSLTIPQFSAKGKEVAGNSSQSEQKADENSDVAKSKASLFNTVSSMNGVVGNDARPSMDVKQTQDSQVIAQKVNGERGADAHSEKNQPLPFQNHVDTAEASRLFRKNPGTEAPNLQKKPPTHTFGNKPALTSISITKFDPKKRVTFENGSGFTFPVSTSSGTLSEPPTPTIMPFPSVSAIPRSADKLKVPSNNSSSNLSEPSFTFGSTNTTRSQLVFSFPSTSSSTLIEGSSPKFNFGSDKSKRISFSSVGGNSIY